MTPGFPVDEADTTCIPALQIYLRALREKFGGRITVISFQYPYRSRSYQWHGVDVYALGGKNIKLMKPILQWKVRRLVAKIHRGRPISHIHSFWIGECAWVGARISQKYGLPHFCTAMGQDVRLGNHFISRLGKSLGIVCLSKFHANDLYRNYDIESQIIPWGLDDQDRLIQKKEIDIIGVGSLIPLKRYRDFLSIVANLTEHYPDLQCVILGDGPEREKLESLIKAKNLGKNLTLRGSLPYDETQAVINRSKVLLHPSEFESFGMVIIEALSMGVPVVARAVGIAAELTAVHKMASMEEGILQIRSILNGMSESPRHQFSIQGTVDQYLNLYTYQR